MLKVSDGRAVDVVETLILDEFMWRGPVKEGLRGKPNRCDDLGGGVGYERKNES